MYAIRDGDRLGTHKEVAPKRVMRDEGDVQKLVNCFTSGLMTDPFKQETDSLVNFATGVVLPAELAENLVDSTDKGRAQMNTFIEKRLNTNEVSFWDPVQNLKVQTFNTMTKKIRVKASDEKLVTVRADRDLFGRLLIAANVRQINLKEVLSYELSPIPFALAHQDGSLRKTNKSVFSKIMENNVNVLPRLHVSLVQMTKSGGANTFGDLTFKYYTIIVAPLSQNNCNEVHIVFDQYWNTSIKAGERLRRGTTSALEVQISGPSTPVPKQWGKYIANPQNKVNLCDFLTDSLCKIGGEKLAVNKKLIIGGGFKDGERTVCVTQGHYEDIPALKSNQEEADTRVLLHAKHVTHPGSRIVIQSPDTDVLVLSATHFYDLNCEELWFKTGVKDRLRYIPVHDISRTVGEKLCKALPAFHALTGCDSNSALAGIGKKKAWDVLRRSDVHQENLGHLGESHALDQVTSARCEAFICDLYPSKKKPPSTADELRYMLFCRKKQKSEMLPPTTNSLHQHLKRANYQAFVWRSSLEAIQDVPSPEGNGWEKEGTVLKPVYMTNEPAPRSLLELTTCQCKKSGCKANCSCNNTGLSCTEACFCMADADTCKNPHGLMLDYSGESDDCDSD